VSVPSEGPTSAATIGRLICKSGSLFDTCRLIFTSRRAEEERRSRLARTLGICPVTRIRALVGPLRPGDQSAPSHVAQAPPLLSANPPGLCYPASCLPVCLAKKMRGRPSAPATPAVGDCWGRRRSGSGRGSRVAGRTERLRYYYYLPARPVRCPFRGMCALCRPLKASANGTRRLGGIQGIVGHSDLVRLFRATRSKSRTLNAAQNY
jgi:hypothetical protein